MKKILIISVVCIVIIAVGGWFLFADESAGTPDNPVGTLPVSPSVSDRIDAVVQEQVVRDFGYGVMLFYEDERISVLHYDQTDSYLITLNRATQITPDLAYAERTFLSLLEINQAQACSLNVEIVVPQYLNLENDNTYGLSFCTNN